MTSPAGLALVHARFLLLENLRVPIAMIFAVAFPTVVAVSVLFGPTLCHVETA